MVWKGGDGGWGRVDGEGMIMIMLFFWDRMFFFLMLLLIYHIPSVLGLAKHKRSMVQDQRLAPIPAMLQLLELRL